MSEANKLTMVRDYWRHSDEGLRGEFARMHEGFGVLFFKLQTGNWNDAGYSLCRDIGM